MRHYNGVVYYTAPSTRYYRTDTPSALIKTFRTFRRVPVCDRECEFRVLFKFFKSFRPPFVRDPFPAVVKLRFYSIEQSENRRTKFAALTVGDVDNRFITADYLTSDFSDFLTPDQVGFDYRDDDRGRLIRIGDVRPGFSGFLILLRPCIFEM